MKPTSETYTPRYRLCSVIGGAATRYVEQRTPSPLIPFSGELPILDTIDAERFREEIASTEKLEDLSPKFQHAALEGYRIAQMVSEFREYLYDRGISPEGFVKLSNAEKSDHLLDWMNTNAVSMASLKITRYHGQYQV